MLTPDFFRKDTRSCGCAETSVQCMIAAIKIGQSSAYFKIKQNVGKLFLNTG